MTNIVVSDEIGEIRILETGPEELGPYGEVFRNRFVVFRNDPVEFPDGSQGAHVSLAPAANPVGGAAMLPMFENKLILSREFRHGIRGWQIGIPRGFADEGETSEQAARRELEEEYGVANFSLELLGKMSPDSSIQTAIVDVYLARLVSLPEMVGEFVPSVPVVLTVSDAMAALGNGEMTDSFLAFALLKALASGAIDRTR